MQRVDNWVPVGKLAKSHGLKGELKFRPNVPDPGVIQSLTKVRLGIEGKEIGEHVYENIGVRGHYSKLILKLSGVDSVELAKTLTGQTVYAPKEDFPELPGGGRYWFEIVGLKVYDEEGMFFGEIEEILNTGSSDIYVVRDKKRELMLPAIDDVIKSMDIENGRLVFHRIEGLIEDDSI